MLVIISDLHLTDGTSGETISAGAFRIFRARLSDMAYDASWRSNGKYNPIKKIDLILLGDILDLIRSAKWMDDTVRPWDDYTSQPLVDKIQAINSATLQYNHKSLAALRSISKEGAVTIPPATNNSQVADVPHGPTHQDRLPVQVNIHYMVGNHDWFYHLPDPAYDQIRQEVIDAVGLTQSPQKPFPHDLTETPELEAICAQHEVSARHGDIYDSDNFEKERNASSLGDAIVIELINRFPIEVKKRLGHKLPQPTLDGLKEIDNVRPMLVIPIWINGLLQQTCNDEQLAQDVKDIWDELADDFLKLPFVQAHNVRLKWDRVNQLELALKFSKGLSLKMISALITLFQGKTLGADISYHETAFDEPAFKNKTAKYIVHGHTHHQEIVPLRSTQVGGKRYDQMYLNCGTWRRVHELARFTPQNQRFQGYHEMTYFAFYRAGERKGRPFEVWSGTLGVT